MDEAGQEVNGADSAAVLAEARQLGWVPREEFRGDPARWTDAETFVQRGHEVMPLLRANNTRLLEELTAVRAQLKEMHGTVEALQAADAEITKERVAAVKKELMAGIKAAREDGDVETEVALTGELAGLKAAEKAPPPAPPQKPADPAVDPAFTAWAALPENQWFGRDKRRTALAMGIAEELRGDRANDRLVGIPFYERVAAEVEATINPRQPPVDRVEGSRGGSGGSGGAGRARTYASLPADAKAVCDRQAKQFVGKPGFKDVAAWNAHYVKVYFGDES